MGRLNVYPYHHIVFCLCFPPLLPLISAFLPYIPGAGGAIYEDRQAPPRSDCGAAFS